MANKALLIGINDYKFQFVPDLRGCHNDTTNIRHILMNYFDFATENISLLVDHSVTKERVRLRMEWLFSDLQPGDQTVFYFSGHGSYIRDFDGDEKEHKLKDEVDELICLYDMDWRNPESYFTDDELRQWTQQLPKGVELTVVMDCCHSGTITRSLGPPPDLAPPGAPSPQDYRAIRFAPPPVDIEARIDEREPMKVRRMLRGLDDRELNHMLLSGCQDDQQSAEAFIGGGYAGAFTYYLCKRIRDVGTQVTYEEIIAHVLQSLLFNGYDQTPQCEGPFADRLIFSKKK